MRLSSANKSPEQATDPDTFIYLLKVPFPFHGDVDGDSRVITAAGEEINEMGVVHLQLISLCLAKVKDDVQDESKDDENAEEQEEGARRSRSTRKEPNFFFPSLIPFSPINSSIFN